MTEANEHYEPLAVRVFDIMDGFGSCQIQHLADTDGLRRAVRREARRRKVKIITRAVSESMVMVATDEPSVLANAYREVSMPLVMDAVDESIRAAREHRPQQPPTLDISVRVIDAAEF